MPPRTDTESRRKAQIIQATRDVICEKGVDRTTMRDIGNRAGMSAAIVCYYFDDKKRLMKETLIDSCLKHRTTLTEIIERDLSPAKKIELMVEEEFPTSEADLREWRFWLEYWAEAARDEELRVFIAEADVRFRKHFERVIVEGANSGAFRADVPPAVLAMDVAATIDGFAKSAMHDPERITLDAARAAGLRIVLLCK